MSSDGKNTVVSETVYGEYGAPAYRIDYQGKDHGVGLPHIHIYYWGMREGSVVRTNRPDCFPYRKE